MTELGLQFVDNKQASIKGKTDLVPSIHLGWLPKGLQPGITMSQPMTGNAPHATTATMSATARGMVTIHHVGEEDGFLLHMMHTGT
jgi:hypothetical protein